MDSVDDIHSLEDAVGQQGAVLRRVADFARKQPWTGLADAHSIEGFEDLLSDVYAAAGSSYDCRRATCEYDAVDREWLCGEDCGCPVTHDHPGHAGEEDDT
jgi:hypothetical protein